MQRWRGLKAIVIDVVEHGSRAVQRVHMETAQIPFAILEQIPPLEQPVKGIHKVHDFVSAGVYGAIRAVNRGVGVTLDVVLDVIEEESARAAAAESAQGAPAPEPEEPAKTQ